MLTCWYLEGQIYTKCSWSWMSLVLQVFGLKPNYWWWHNRGKVNAIYPQRGINVWTTCYCHSSSSYREISLITTNVNIMTAERGKSGDHWTLKTVNSSFLMCYFCIATRRNEATICALWCICIPKCLLSVCLLVLEWHSIICLPWETFAASALKLTGPY